MARSLGDILGSDIDNLTLRLPTLRFGTQCLVDFCRVLESRFSTLLHPQASHNQAHLILAPLFRGYIRGTGQGIFPQLGIHWLFSQPSKTNRSIAWAITLLGALAKRRYHISELHLHDPYWCHSVEIEHWATGPLLFLPSCSHCYK